MHLVFDIGNTNIVCGVFNATKKDYEIKKNFRLVTPQSTTTDELAFNVINLLKQNGIEKNQIKSGIFCSVVPNLNHNITKMMNLYFDIDIKQVTFKLFNDFHIHYQDNEDLGMDRLINMKSGAALGKLPLIIVDLGTATTVDVLDLAKKYLGGMIIPGIAISLDALVGKTSRLPNVELQYPEKLLGKSTKECMQNGIYFSNALGLENIILEISKKYFPKSSPQIILTGGLAKFIASNFKTKIEIIPELTLKGLKMILDEID